jgi:hypothetical protein
MTGLSERLGGLVKDPIKFRHYCRSLERSWRNQARGVKPIPHGRPRGRKPCAS